LNEKKLLKTGESPEDNSAQGPTIAGNLRARGVRDRNYRILTLLTRVLPPEQELEPEMLGIMEMVQRMNVVNRKLQQVIAESGNGRRFQETRDLLYRDMMRKLDG
jgi:hypothetical protein